MARARDQSRGTTESIKARSQRSRGVKRGQANKYGSRRTEVDGIKFASAMEARRYQYLKEMEKTGRISDLSLQVRFPFKHDGQLICTYVADFLYIEDGEPIVEDVKGRVTPVYAIKRKMMKAFYGKTIREVRDVKGVWEVL